MGAIFHGADDDLGRAASIPTMTLEIHTGQVSEAAVTMMMYTKRRVRGPVTC
jgi:hypothetical protein